eukprot:CAMPEP_0184663398 /NCGR_PEP_ID=MMETSP0308-20130426/47953_1 /TAXON_ID=38269 /ORGANISM="Gloeochaete witrockiana, Strain SAG 46.84" /LENGTH=387 /DNA_ID=CAMNT_0027106107 /DNA_START=12 /DNA_END=1172 /DNA_ORIENTATION=+
MAKQHDDEETAYPPLYEDFSLKRTGSSTNVLGAPNSPSSAPPQQPMSLSRTVLKNTIRNVPTPSDQKPESGPGRPSMDGDPFSVEGDQQRSKASPGGLLKNFGIFSWNGSRHLSSAETASLSNSRTLKPSEAVTQRLKSPRGVRNPLDDSMQDVLQIDAENQSAPSRHSVSMDITEGAGIGQNSSALNAASRKLKARASPEVGALLGSSSVLQEPPLHNHVDSGDDADIEDQATPLDPYGRRRPGGSVQTSAATVPLVGAARGKPTGKIRFIRKGDVDDDDILDTSSNPGASRETAGGTRDLTYMLLGIVVAAVPFLIIGAGHVGHTCSEPLNVYLIIQALMIIIIALGRLAVLHFRCLPKLQLQNIVFQCVYTMTMVAIIMFAVAW